MRFLIVIILSLILFSCSTSIDNVTITQIESNYPIIIGLEPSQNSDSIRYIGIPFVFSISQNSFNKIYISGYDYFYNTLIPQHKFL